jgi:hypothetical protein
VDIRIILIVFVALGAAIYSFFHSFQTVTTSAQEQLALESALQSNSQPNIVPQSKQTSKVPEILGLDIQLQRQALANNAANNPLAHENPEDENLVTEVASTDSGTPYPSKMSFRLDERGELLVELNFDGEHQSIARRWNPATGAMKTLLSLSGYYIERGLIMNAGVLFAISKRASDKQASSSLVFIDNTGKASFVDLKVARSDAKLLLLSDQSVLLFGGRNIAEPKARNNSFELVQIKDGAIDVQPLPDVIDPKLWGYNVVALPNVRALLLGGSNDQYISCREPSCSKKTFLLDASTKTWSDGPLLKEPHADAGASLLPDGSLIIAGGWRSDKNGNVQASNTSERWVPGEPSFKAAASLPIATAKIRDISADTHTSFMLISKDEGYVQAYDTKNNEWRLVASFCGAEGDYAFGLGPFGDKQNFYLWMNSTGKKNAWKKMALGVSPANGEFFSSSFTPNLGGYFYNNEVNYLPPSANQSGVVAGATLNDTPNASAIAVSFAGKLTPLATLNYPRTNAQVFRLSDGAIVVAGGVPEDENNMNSNLPSLELLMRPDLSNHWKVLNIVHPVGTRYGQAANGNVIALLPEGRLEQIAVEVIDAEPRVIKTPLGRMINPREYSYDSPIVLRGLSDGKIIIGGGCIRAHQIAVIYDKPATNTEGESESADEDVANLGTCSPNNSYDIYTPASRSWRKSTNARYSASQSAILADGRVVRMGELQIPESSKPDSQANILPANTVVEIANAEGNQWQLFIGDDAPPIKFYSAKLFVVDEEIFVSGMEQLASGNGEHRIVQWFDASAKHWVTVWSQEPRSEKDPITLIQVKLANQKILMLPIPH